MYTIYVIMLYIAFLRQARYTRNGCNAFPQKTRQRNTAEVKQDLGLPIYNILNMVEEL